MNNVWDEMTSALQQSRAVNYASDRNATAMAEIIKGRLRHVNAWTLVAMKRELQSFNAVTREWKP